MNGEKTLSERRISSAGQAVLDQVEKAYELVFVARAADNRFFNELEFVFSKFLLRTKKRPITPRDVKSAQRLFRDECRKVMSDAKRRIAAD